MREWIVGIAAASLLSALALALTPEGRVRQVTRLVCGIVCALAMVSPAAELDIEDLAVGIAEYEQMGQSITQQSEEEAKMLNRTYIEEACEAYILDKAEQADIAVTGVSVTARWDDEALVWYPWQVELEGPYSLWLSQTVEAQLGIPASRQTWSGS